MEPDAYLFDLDGVLVETFDVWLHLQDDIAGRLGYPPVTREQLEKTWGQGVDEDVAVFFPRHTVEEIRAEYAARYERHLGHLKVMEGADRALGAIRRPKAVITNSTRVLALRALEVARLAPHFDTVVGSDEVARSKPAPDVVFEACRRLKVEPLRALVIGDSRYDEEAAQAAGAGFVRFRSFAELRLP